MKAKGTTILERMLTELSLLSPEDRDQLRIALDRVDATDRAERLRKRIEGRTRATPEQIAATLNELDRVAAMVGAAWKSNMSALEAVQEQRREL